MIADPHDQLQPLPVVKDELQVPTEAEHRRLIFKIFLTCIVTATTIFLVFGGIVLALFLKGYDSKRIVEVSTSIFQVLSMSGAVGFFIPLGLASIVTLFIGIRMSRKSVSVLDKLDTAVESRLVRVDKIMDKMETAFANAEKGRIPASVQKMIDEGKTFAKEELGKLRDEIKGARTSTEQELSEALDQGELEAAAVAGGTPELEARSPHGPGHPCPCNDGNICQEGVCPCGGVCHGHGACGCGPKCSCVQCMCPYCTAAIKRFYEGRGQPEGAQAH